ncbi:MAG: type II secretion system GspH family protein [Coriobacteriales bacterium]|nr:type II secretion system GspH family protein [Coriobacteriales bacterium]
MNQHDMAPWHKWQQGMNQQALTQQGMNQQGMTLVEVIVSLAIVAVVALIALTAFASALRYQEISSKHATANATIEEQIAEFNSPTSWQSLPGGGLRLGSATIPVIAQTFSDGSRDYTILDGQTAPQVTFWEYGDGALANGNNIIDTGAQGGTLQTPFTVRISGTYKLEAWGAKCIDNGAGGAYALSYVQLVVGDTLSIFVGGVQTPGLGIDGGTSAISDTLGTMLCAGSGGLASGANNHFACFATGDNSVIIDGSLAMPDPLNSTGPMIYGNGRGGFVRLTWLGY